jgi:hypothetical protein
MEELNQIQKSDISDYITKSKSIEAFSKVFYFKKSDVPLAINMCFSY